MASIGDLVAFLKLDFSQFSEGAHKASHETEGMRDKFKEHMESMKESALETAGSIAAAFGVGFGIEKGIEAIKGQIEKITELVHLSERTGIDLNDLRALQFEAKHAGVEFETLQKSITKMQVNLGDAAGGGKKAAIFEQLKLDPQELAKMNPAEAFAKVGDAIAGLEDPTSRVHFAFELLGKTGAETLGVLLSGTKGLKYAQAKVGIISPDDVEEMHHAHEAMLNLDAAGAKLSRTFAADVAPAIQKVADVLTDSIKTINLFIQGSNALREEQERRDKGEKGHGKKWMNWVYGDGGEDLIQSVADVEPYRQKQTEKKKKSDGKALLETQMAAEAEYAKSSDKMAKDGEQMAEALQTPYEKAVEEFDKAQDLFNNNAIDEDTFARAFTKMGDEANKALEGSLKPFEEEWKKMQEQAKSLVEDSYTPLEKYKEKVAEITALWADGAMSDEEAAGAMVKQKEDLYKATHKHVEQPKQEHLEAFAVGSRESLQAFVQAFRGGGKDPVQEQQLEAQQATATAVATVAQNTDPQKLATLFPIWNIDGLGTS